MFSTTLLALLASQWSTDATEVAKQCAATLPGVALPECFCAGACPRKGEDWSAAFDRMVMSPKCAPGAFDVYPNREHRKSCSIHLSQEYTLRKRLEFPRPSRVTGVGHPQGAAQSTLRFTECRNAGVKVPGNSDVSYPGKHIGGGLLLDSVSIEFDNPTCTSSATHGLTSAGQVHLRDSQIVGFPGDGWKITAPEGGTAIDSTVFGLRISRSGRHGLLVTAGSNNNSIEFNDLNVDSACRFEVLGATDLDGLPACAGVRFSGNLGANFYGPNVDMMSRDWPSFIVSNRSASTGSVRFFGPYAEPNAVFSRTKYATVYGNLPADPRDRTLQVGARGIEGSAEFRNGEVVTKLGPTAPVSAIEVVSPLGTWNAFTRPEGLCFVAGRVAPSAFCVAAAGTVAGVPANRLRADQIYVGKGRPVYVSAGPKSARPLATSVPLGSIYHNATPIAGQPLAWVACDVGGSGRQWCKAGDVGPPD